MRLTAISIAELLVLGTSLVSQSATSGTPLPDAAGVYRVSKGVNGPKVLSSVEPDFTELARKKKISGNCTMDVVVDATGHVSEVKVTHSVAQGQPEKLRKAAESLDAKAVEAVRRYTFEPGSLNGKAVAVRTIIDLNFAIF